MDYETQLIYDELITLLNQAISDQTTRQVVIDKIDNIIDHIKYDNTNTWDF